MWWHLYQEKKIPLSFSNNLCGQLVRTNGMHSWPRFLKLQSHVDIYILNVYKYEELFILLSCKWWASANQTALRRCGPLTWVCRLWPHKRIARLCFSFLVKEIVQSYLNTQPRGCQMLMLTNAYENINLWGLEILQTFSVASEMLSNFGYVWKLGKVWGSQRRTFGHAPQTVTVFGPF